jgi:hypothetical protein
MTSLHKEEVERDVEGVREGWKKIEGKRERE